MIFTFAKLERRTQELEQKAMVFVTLDQDLKVAKFNVDLDSIPGANLDGFEVVAQF